jgi:hypothetical protein
VPATAWRMGERACALCAAAAQPGHPLLAALGRARPCQLPSWQRRPPVLYDLLKEEDEGIHEFATGL